jgi:hypothetical protein
MLKCLSITIFDSLQEDSLYNSKTFFKIQRKNIKWIYVLSENIDLLTEFKEKLESYTPKKHLKHMEIGIDNVSDLTAETWVSNRMHRTYERDKFHLESVCNDDPRSDKYTINEFTAEIWRGPGGLTLGYDIDEIDE